MTKDRNSCHGFSKRLYANRQKMYKKIKKMRIIQEIQGSKHINQLISETLTEIN